MRSLVLILFISSSIYLSGQNIFVSNSNSQIWKTNPNTCTSVLVGTTPQNFLDIAFLPNGKMYGQENSGIYEVDTTNASSTLILAVNTGNSLVGAPNGMLYSVDDNDDLLQIDVNTSTITNLGQVNCGSAGDLAFFQGKLYLTCDNSDLLEIDTLNPGASFPVGNLNINSDPFGLANAGNNCFVKPYVLSRSGTLYQVDYTNAAVSSPCTMGISGDIYGAASPYEFETGLPSNIIPNTASICPGESITINGETAGASGYIWSTGETSDSIIVNQAGTYSIKVYKGVCDTVYDTITISEINITPTLLGNDTTVCTGQSVLLNASTTNSTYLWQNGTTQPTLLANQSGIYWVDITTPCETVRDSIVISNHPQYTIDLGEDTTLCDGVNITLDATTPNSSYLWSNGSNDASINVATTGSFDVTVTTICNTLYDTIDVAFITCEPIIVMPNVFTPNNDGQNDYFKPITAVNIENAELFIYNRWGNVVFKTSDLSSGWDGKSSVEGVYYWIVKYSSSTNEKTEIKGIVHLFN